MPRSLYKSGERNNCKQSKICVRSGVRVEIRSGGRPEQLITGQGLIADSNGVIRYQQVQYVTSRADIRRQVKY